MKHTPAPWKKIKNITSFGVQIGSAGGFVFHYGMPDQEANANLIAAAPELLEACKIIVNAFDSLSQSSPARNETLHINAARAAIAKATGAE